MMGLARQQARASAEQMQLAIIISDGRGCNRNSAWGDPSAWIRRAAEQHILLCFIVIDSARSSQLQATCCKLRVASN